jgi:hypothetical protein
VSAAPQTSVGSHAGAAFPGAVSAGAASAGAASAGAASALSHGPMGASQFAGPQVVGYSFPSTQVIA